MTKNYFEILNAINVSDKIEKKNNLSYLSWSYAWQEVKKLHPEANYKVFETAEGCIYWTDGKTCWVKTGVTINNIEHIEYLPVMDFRNKSIPANAITSMDVNKAIQRSLTKAIARHGLGLYIYAGEDLPDGEEEKLSRSDAKQLKGLAEGVQEDYRAENEKQFRRIKELFEGAGSIAEIEGFKEQNMKYIKGLKKYAPDLCDLLKACTEELIKNFGEDND